MGRVKTLGVGGGGVYSCCESPPSSCFFLVVAKQVCHWGTGIVKSGIFSRLRMCFEVPLITVEKWLVYRRRALRSLHTEGYELSSLIGFADLCLFIFQLRFWSFLLRYISFLNFINRMMPSVIKFIAAYFNLDADTPSKVFLICSLSLRCFDICWLFGYSEQVVECVFVMWQWGACVAMCVSSF